MVFGSVICSSIWSSGPCYCILITSKIFYCVLGLRTRTFTELRTAALRCGDIMARYLPINFYNIQIIRPLNTEFLCSVILLNNAFVLNISLNYIQNLSSVFIFNILYPVPVARWPSLSRYYFFFFCPSKALNGNSRNNNFRSCPHNNHVLLLGLALRTAP